MRAVKKIGEYRLYKVDGWGHYEIWFGTMKDGVHVDNIADPDNFEWAIDEIRAGLELEMAEIAHYESLPAEDM